MDVAALISGGKDSMLALYRMHLAGHRIKYLLIMEPKTNESYMFHHPNIWITKLVSDSLGIKFLSETTHGRKEEELTDLLLLLKKVSPYVEGIVTGALASTYQKTRIDELCKKLSLHSIAPLWQMKPLDLWQELFEYGFVVMITAVSAEGLGKDWLGKVIDETSYFEKLKILSEKHRFHLGFEGGEAETLVLDMPLYKKRISVKEAKAVWQINSGTYEIKKAALEEK